MEFLEFEGKTTEEAINNACTHFGAPPEDLEIEIMSVGSSGIFGLGGKKAKVRASRRAAAELDLVEPAREVLEQILHKMGEPATVTGVQDAGKINLTVQAEDAGLIIGKQGLTLEALQYLVTKILTKQSGHKVRVVIDIESYRARHNQSLVDLAVKYGEKVKKTGKSITPNPMNPYDRRIVHLALQGDKELKTISRGEGLYKKVVIYLNKRKEDKEDAPSYFSPS